MKSLQTSTQNLYKVYKETDSTWIVLSKERNDTIGEFSDKEWAKLVCAHVNSLSLDILDRKAPVKSVVGSSELDEQLHGLEVIARNIDDDAPYSAMRVREIRDYFKSLLKPTSRKNISNTCEQKFHKLCVKTYCICECHKRKKIKKWSKK